MTKPQTPKAPTAPEFVKTTLRLRTDLWNKVQHRAIDESLSLVAITERALELYLKSGKP